MGEREEKRRKENLFMYDWLDYIYYSFFPF
jgi:hypothetical protein